VFNQYRFTHNVIRSISFLVLFTLSMIGDASPAAAQGCQSALDSSTGYTALTNATTATRTKTVDEWDDDVLKITTQRPGVITIESTGPGAQNSVYTDGSTLSHPLVDSAYQGTGLGDLEVIVPPGNHCIQVAPSTTGSATIAIAATFVDACHLGDIDDYGDSFLCAEPIAIDGSANGVISVPGTTSDYDVFTFSLSSAATLTLESSGSTDVAGSLYDDDGVLLESNDNGGSSPNFRIVRSLSAGRYYLRVQGVSDDGSYSLSVTD
jgi:outer membrane lipoprotein-sorting protein